MKTDATVPQEVSDYYRIFQESLSEMHGFLKAFFSSFFWQWGGGFTVLPAGPQERIFEDPKSFEPFCFHVREILKLGDACLQCDARRAAEACRAKRPIDYWCDCGMRDLAAPINVHGICVGTILCGQKRLAGADDVEGENVLRAWATLHGQGHRIQELLEKRTKTRAVTRDDVERMKRLMQATSEYISHILYATIDHKFGQVEEETGDILRHLIKSIMRLGTESNTKRLWGDYASVLLTLKDVLDFTRVALFLTEEGRATIVADTGVPDATRTSYNESALITSQLAPFDGPRHMLLSESPLTCPFCTTVVTESRDISLIVYERASLPRSRAMHLIVFFASDSQSRKGFLLHQKKEILSRALMETISVFLHLERVQELKDNLKDKLRLLQDVSHNTQQTLHSVVGHCDNLLLMDLAEAHVNRTLRYIREHALRGSILTRGVLLASRTGRQISLCPKPQRTWREFSLLLVDHAINLQGYSEELDVDIHIDRASTDGIGQILLDRLAFDIVLTNILFNAVKYSFPHTKIVVSATRKTTAAIFEVRFRNQGIEIPAHKRASIFNRGERTSEAVRYSQSGLGLGLFITKGILLAMDGDICVESCTPTGVVFRGFQECETTFLVTLPSDILREV